MMTFMRTIVDLPKSQIAALDIYRKAQKISRAEAVRRAIAAFIPKRPKTKEEWMKHPAFGSWNGGKIDAVKYIKDLRSDWD